MTGRERGDETVDLAALENLFSPASEIASHATHEITTISSGSARCKRDDETVDIAALAGLLSPTADVADQVAANLSTVHEEEETFASDHDALEDYRGFGAHLRSGGIRLDNDDGAPGFGDLSGIAFAEEEATLTVNFSLALKRSVKYKDHYEMEMKAAVQRLKANGLGRLPGGVSLVDAFSSKGVVCSCPTDVIPRAFRENALGTGTEVKIGRKSAVVVRELGRGAFGIVALLGDGLNTTNYIAVKVQRPASCLSLEYELMTKLNDRISPRDPSACGSFFPQPLTYLATADGSIVSMTAGSTSGLNVLDLVNVYTTKLGCGVPGIIALHYTARMLHHLELLHWHGKVLHCDTKSDNWVLTTSDLVSAGKDVGGAELMLVDFGKAIDLESAAKQAGMGALEVLLTGEASVAEMQCVAMRKGLPWSYDIDTYGVCATAHVLLFGKHMTLVQNDRKRWMPAESIELNDQRELWMTIFDSLLNLDEISRTAMGSHPNSVRRLRAQIEAFLSSRRDDLIEALERQARALPKSRQELYVN